MINNKIELLAPAGSYESLTAAMNAGCNAVYFGVEHLEKHAVALFHQFYFRRLKEIRQKM